MALVQRAGVVEVLPPCGRAPLGRQAKGLPSGAKQVPVALPLGEVKLQAAPLADDLHASTASTGGRRGSGFALDPPEAWAMAAAPTQAVAISSMGVRI